MSRRILEKRVSILAPFVLVLLTGTVSFLLLVFSAYLSADGGNAVFVEDKMLDIKVAGSGLVVLFSFMIFRKFTHFTTNVVRFHLATVVLLLLYFPFQYASLRSEQQQILVKYQTFRQAVLDKDYEAAYGLLAPMDQAEGLTDELKRGFTQILQLRPEDSLYSVRIHGETAFIVPDPSTSRWYRTAGGPSWTFKKVNAEWYPVPTMGASYYIAF